MVCLIVMVCTKPKIIIFHNIIIIIDYNNKCLFIYCFMKSASR